MYDPRADQIDAAALADKKQYSPSNDWREGERDVSAPAQEKPQSITASDAEGEDGQVPIDKDKKK